MDRTDYTILIAMAAAIAGLGTLASSQPIDSFLVSAVSTAITTTVEMVWITWWALVLGFAVAGGVEAWVADEEIADLLQGHSPKTICAATFFGFVSSSCSYSAIATAKNLFKKGASAPAALAAFMFASTNLVIEIGIVIWILLGWQFLLANLIGGLLLIALMSIGFVIFVPEKIINTAREHVIELEGKTETDPVCGMDVDPDATEYSVEHESRTYYFCSDSCLTSFDPQEVNTTIGQQATSLAGWKSLADKQWKEWGMLWDEIAIGFVFAGLIAGFVPQSVWTSLFSGSVYGTPVFVVGATVLGAIIGVATFVCSVGNVPFGAILYQNGLPFGAVLSYIYADLIVPPIMKAYDDYYGRQFAALLSLMIFVAAVLTGIIIHFVFLGSGLIPPHTAVTFEETTIGINYKLALNVLATIAFTVLYWLHRNHDGVGNDHHEH